MDLKLQGKVVLITGAAAGIGKATAEAFRAEGATVVGWDVKAEEGIAPVHRVHQVNVTDADAVEAGVAAILEEHGRLDVLINNAGITRDAQLVKVKDGEIVGRMSEAAWDAVLDVNLKGVFLCTRAVVPAMQRQGGGVILNASSVVGLYGNFGQTNYAATKGGVITMTQTWARELGRFGIRVNAVAPGFIATEMVLAIPEKIRERMAGATPLGKLGKPEDIANAYLWLASDAAGFVHGATLSVDGGLVP